MGDLLEKHPIWMGIAAILGFILISIPVYLGTIWPILQWLGIIDLLPPGHMLPQWVAERRWPGMNHTFFMWFTTVAAVGMAGLLGVIIRTVGQRKQEAKQFEAVTEELHAARRTIGDLQARLSAIEDQRPRLKAKPILVQRKLTRKQHMFVGPKNGRIKYISYHGGLGSFALLQITNDPESKNSHAIAKDLRAKLTYYDDNWKAPLLSIDGAWISPNHKSDPEAIGDIYTGHSVILKPLESVHLCVALKYTWDDPSECHALNGDSRQWADWRHKEYRLYGKSINVKVIIGGHGIRETYHYILKNRGAEDGLLLEPTSPPTS
jgi:hypothetical protein